MVALIVVAALVVVFVGVPILVDRKDRRRHRGRRGPAAKGVDAAAARDARANARAFDALPMMNPRDLRRR